MEESPSSELELKISGGDPDDSVRLCGASVRLSASTREDGVVEKDGVTPFTAGEDACDGLLDTVVALGDEARRATSIPSRPFM